MTTETEKPILDKKTKTIRDGDIVISNTTL